MDDRAWRELFDELRAETRRNRERYEELGAETVRALRALAEEIREHRDEARADARAHREALFRMLDRLSPGDSPA
jgi:hypothetical protein